LYPDAKVILTIRDTPEKWWRSASETILRMGDVHDPKLVGFGMSHFFKFNPIGWLLMYMWQATYLQVFPAGSQDAKDGMEKYQSWNTHIEKIVPKEKLLVFNVNVGWGPLCRFLNFPVPDVPFPNVNDSQSMKDKFFVFEVAGWATAALYAFLGLRYVRRALWE